MGEKIPMDMAVRQGETYVALVLSTNNDISIFDIANVLYYNHHIEYYMMRC